MVKNRAHDDGCCGPRFLKYILFIFNFLFYLAALFILALGIYTLLARSTYNALLPTSIPTYVTYALIAIGILSIIVGLCGCTAMFKDSKCAVLTFSISLLVIFLLEAGCAVLTYLHAARVHSDLNASLNGTLQQGYHVDDRVTAAADALQQQMYCCGGQDFGDWRKSVWYDTVNTPADTKQRDGKPLRVPAVCCRDEQKLPDCGINDHPSFIYPDGCWRPLATWLRDYEVILAGLVLGVSLVQLFGLIITCCLYAKMDDDDEEVNRRLAATY